MKKYIILFILILSNISFADDFSVSFSPNGGSQQEIINEINSAKHEVLVQAYVLTSKPIAYALDLAAKRNVNIIVILDYRQSFSKYSQKNYLKNNNIKVLLDSKHNIAHNKIIIIDQVTLITGSYNYSINAEKRNAENLLIIKNNTPIIEQYVENFRNHQNHSKD